MTAKQNKMYQNIQEWRSLSSAKRRSVLRSTAVRQTAGSMAMEGEPVSQSWIKKNSR